MPKLAACSVAWFMQFSNCCLLRCWFMQLSNSADCWDFFQDLSFELTLYLSSLAMLWHACTFPIFHITSSSWVVIACAFFMPMGAFFPFMNDCWTQSLFKCEISEEQMSWAYYKLKLESEHVGNAQGQIQPGPIFGHLSSNFSETEPTRQIKHDRIWVEQ